MNFCPQSYMLLEAITSQDNLVFKSNKTGTIYDAAPEHTILASEDVSDVQGISKFTNTLKVAAYDPVNARVRIQEGCDKCGRKIVSMQRLGDEKKVVFVCLCGNSWST